MNLERSITITGDHGDFQETGQGWHGGAFLDTKAALDVKVFLDDTLETKAIHNTKAFPNTIQRAP